MSDVNTIYEKFAEHIWDAHCRESGAITGKYDLTEWADVDDQTAKIWLNVAIDVVDMMRALQSLARQH